MRHEYQVKYPEFAHKIKFFIGDVRNLQSCRNAMPNVDYIFHAAALKQVPSCEFFPMEAVKTNVIGTDNVLTAAIEAKVGAVICLSTDKAAYPINAMGITKAIEEKIAVAKSRYSGDTKICCTRYGNVMCSRGSVIPLCSMTDTDDLDFFFLATEELANSFCLCLNSTSWSLLNKDITILTMLESEDHEINSLF